ncbi:MAG: Gfo/Idh/MocA family oxidoreductase [Paludisphaera borealis]|uniref:Gfo/Idh/MocA family protein n=1 Tax=Paludisphaera borealis TaxID=1387353 RepID=UPI002840ADE0|nr:Gfo/Idh/MocA family oxidoreductase [Paludisphaera borealis]MDR3620735.1 Gfo/Idh/MocA family oxidoreductase [Paludisphaera borealis]
MDQGQIRIGVVGCGGFGLYALQQFVQIPGVRLTAMAGTSREASRAAAHRFGVPDIEDVDTLVHRDDVDLVYIATPPFLHHPQAMKALRAGKHVICEKPLAMTVAQADEMLAEARRGDRLLTANLMQRYNPVSDAVGRLISEKILGEPIHAFFENYASDENLGPDHWFWDRSKSGGIFIEHGVHFFDLFEGWLGRGKVVAAQRGIRPGSAPPIEEQVQCTMRYANDVLVNYYHGFHQPGRMDRQEMRLVFERGDVTLFGWIPTLVKVHAVADEAQTRALCDLFPGARLDSTSTYAPKDRACSARHQTLDVYQTLELTWGEGVVKSHRYGELLRAVMADQVAWIRDRLHPRRVTETNGRDSLAIACEADRLAQL